MVKKVGRNQPCPCGSGKKYKYCCGMYDDRERIVKVPYYCPNCGAKHNAEINCTNDFMNKYSTSERPLKEFCKDNGIYLFGWFTIKRGMELLKELNSQTLTTDIILNEYKKIDPKLLMSLLEDAIREIDYFRKRAQILRDAFNAHFEKKYTLSVTTLFAQLEGLLRDYSALPLNETFCSKIKTDFWDRYLAFPIKDDAQYFNAFVNNLYEGSKPAENFNRNTILHGANVQYQSEEHSILLLLAILEIRTFVFYERELPKLYARSRQPAENHFGI